MCSGGFCRAFRIINSPHNPCSWDRQTVPPSAWIWFPRKPGVAPAGLGLGWAAAPRLVLVGTFIVPVWRIVFNVGPWLGHACGLPSLDLANSFHLGPGHSAVSHPGPDQPAANRLKICCTLTCAFLHATDSHWGLEGRGQTPYGASLRTCSLAPAVFGNILSLMLLLAHHYLSPAQNVIGLPQPTPCNY